MVIYLVKNGNSALVGFKEKVFAEMMVQAYKDFYNEEGYEVEYVDTVDWINKLSDMMEYIKTQFGIPDKD